MERFPARVVHDFPAVNDHLSVLDAFYDTTTVVTTIGFREPRQLSTGAKIFTGDSHVLQGDGEVNLTAVESAMREVRVQVILHQNVGWEWPFADTNRSTMIFSGWQETA